MKAIAMAGTGIINSQIPSVTQGKPYYGGAQGTGGNTYEPPSRGTMPTSNHMAGATAGGNGPSMAGNTALGMSAQKVNPAND